MFKQNLSWMFMPYVEYVRHKHSTYRCLCRWICLNGYAEDSQRHNHRSWVVMPQTVNGTTIHASWMVMPKIVNDITIQLRCLCMQLNIFGINIQLRCLCRWICLNGYAEDSMRHITIQVEWLCRRQSTA